MQRTRKDSQGTRTGICSALQTLLLACLLSVSSTHASNQQGSHDKDTHYTDAGFFDVHVCNWPDRPAFFMILFSTVNPDAVKSIEIMTPDMQPLAALDLNRYRTFKQKNKPDKRVVINQIAIPPGAGDGWYSARITLSDGHEYTSKDFVKISRLPQAGGHIPANETEVTLPRSLQWEAVPAAGFYQVFIRDLWNDDKLIHTSKLLNSPELVLPEGLLKPGGYYSWIIHARDTNEDVMLGDFNHGSLNKPATFSVAP
jgi:hypothetical protein